MDARGTITAAVIAGMCAGGALMVSGAMSPEESRLSIEIDSMRNATFAVSHVDATTSGGDALALYTIADAESLSVAGEYERHGSSIVFRPYYPLADGVGYVAVAHAHGRTLREVIGPTDPVGVPRTFVSAIHPTADTLPQNVLRFYVHFSRPMRVGEARTHIELLDETGKSVEHAFLANEQELWDTTRTRLTVLLDPGRIKRGLRPNVELGPPLRTGRRYTLRIAAAYRDSDGAPLVQQFAKAFVVGAPDRAALRTAQWRITTPRAGSLDPIVIHAGRPIDAVLARQFIRVHAPNAANVQIAMTMLDGERTIRLVPARPWIEGTYQVVVGADLEDVAGNNLRRPFDVDLTDAKQQLRDDLAVERIAVRIQCCAITGLSSTR